MTTDSSTSGLFTQRFRGIIAALSSALSWWFGQLGQMLPARIRAGWQQDSFSLILELQNQQLSISAGQQHWTLPSPWDTSSLPETLKQVIAKAQNATLSLADDMILQTRVSVPRNARDYIDNVVRFEMDRLTPFRADQVYFDTGPVTDEPGKEQCHTELYLIPKEQLQTILNQLEQLGITPDRIIPQGFLNQHDSHLNLLPQSDEASRRSRYLRFQFGLVSLNLLLLITVVSLPLAQKQTQIEQLTEAVAQLRSQAEEVFQIREERQTLFQQQQNYVDIKQQQSSVLSLIDELTRLLPDEVWLSKMSMQGRSLRIQGEADNASELIALLQNSGKLTDVSFFSPVTQDPRSGKERFMISARQSPGESHAAQ
ncbi:PilN domain-containing protein [Amphritea pacifica]|uniref:PilN domain-containing protein n=1 Tax=Amphritea pacifica TaxID=2811233 RepID=A0ABS2W7H1_9GAMM|nr:PilN domain-containing protein [Amphritea pacifica]MBN0987523.1 PilN domain-containing protein [Amphritea pacifica]